MLDLETIFFDRSIFDEYTQIMILGVALILKRNSKNKIESLKELDNLIDNEMKYCIKRMESKAIPTINKLLESEEKDLVNAIINMPEIRTIFDVRTPENVAEIMDYLLKIKDGSEVLDLYSGIGKIEEILIKNHKNIKIDGFEIRNGSVEIAKLKMYAIENKNVSYFKKIIKIS